MKPPNRILVLSPHTDDAELGCGGTIARLARTTEVRVVSFSSVGNQALATEAMEAAIPFTFTLTLAEWDFRAL